MQNSLKHYCDLWRLGSPVPLDSTATSNIFLVQYENAPAVIKLLTPAGVADETNASTVLNYFNGQGMAKIYKWSTDAQLIEYIDGKNLLDLPPESAALAACEVIKKLRNDKPFPNLPSLEERFSCLFKSSEFTSAAQVARELLDSASNIGVLHGDIHHENILHSSTRGWLAIDPKGIIGERTYEVANLFYNPISRGELLRAPQKINALAQVFSEQLGFDRKRILAYAFVHGILSALWCMEDGQDPSPRLAIAREIQKLL